MSEYIITIRIIAKKLRKKKVIVKKRHSRGTK